MLSQKAEKTKAIYKRMSFFLSLGVAEPGKVSKFMAGFVRYNFNNIAKFFTTAEGSNYKEVTLGGVPTWKVTTPNSDPNKVLLFFHGGAYMVGSPKAYYPMMSYMADITGFTIYVPDYRLAPENLFPSQLEDGVSTFKALINDCGYSNTQIAIGGDSAGGNLAFVTFLKLKELNEKLPAAITCISPWADPAATGDSYNEEMADKDPLIGPLFKKIWNKFNMKSAIGYYVEKENADPSNPFICPINGNFAGCPPVMIQVGADELLLSDSRTMKEVLDRDSVMNEYKEWENLWHVFQLDGEMEESTKSFEMFRDFLNSHINTKV